MDRKTFLLRSGGAVAGTLIGQTALAGLSSPVKQRIAMVGTGVRGIGMWGAPVIREFGDLVEFVGLCDANPGRVETANKKLGLSCPTFTDFDKMMQETKPDRLLVMTVDGVHHEFIAKGMAYGADIISEKPMTIDEQKCQAILDAEQQTGKKLIVTFNYRYSPHRQKLYELLRNDAIGKLTSVDFHWYLDVYHGADYFRRWHRLRKHGGSLLVHKATHHFDLLNWWIDSDPEEVYANGALEFYGRNNAFRHTDCRSCPYKKECKFYWDITKDPWLTELYVKNQSYDGYLRDGCVWREDIDIFDKMAVQVKYANQVQVSYSLTAYSPYEGYRIAFNGTKGRLEAWIKERQPWEEDHFDELHLTTSFGKREIIRIDNSEGGHGGGDIRLRKQVFRGGDDPYRQAAGSRDGAMSCLVGIAARNSIDTGKPVKIADLTTLRPQVKRS